MKVLIADDDPICRRMLMAFLVKWGYGVTVARSGIQALQLLSEEDGPRLAILDWMMPGMDGAQICQEIRKRAAVPYIYIILLTARSQRQDMIGALEAGADDYLRKPFDPHELRLRLRGGRRILDLQEQLLAAREALHIQATHDPLTGVWNRAAILKILQQELARCERDGDSVGVLMLDLDHFKSVNDTIGHLGGDAVLIETARRMQSSLRIYDAIGRYGGEEFLIISPSCNAARALSLAERLRVGIGEGPVDTSEGKIPLTLSVGVVVGERLRDQESLLRAADVALYRAKQRGRNRVERTVVEQEREDQAPVRAIKTLDHGTGS